MKVIPTGTRNDTSDEMQCVVAWMCDHCKFELYPPEMLGLPMQAGRDIHSLFKITAPGNPQTLFTDWANAAPPTELTL